MRLYKFKSVVEARMAIQKDGLALVTYTATQVIVFSAFGTGAFDRKEWDEKGGPAPSVEGPKVG